MSRKEFALVEATIAEIHAAYRAGALTARQLVEAYLDRIVRFDRAGPRINSVISLHPDALAEADRLDTALKASGMVGPLHGIPLLMKDQADVIGLPTTMGSVLFKDFRPERDGFVVRQLKAAGAILLGKTTLGELGGGDTHGSLFGSTRNPYDLERTAGGSSGGSGAAVAANFCMAAIGQEGFASIRRPATWNSISGMRPTAGLVSRSGVFGGWPTINGSLGPMARSVADLASVLDAMVGYDGEDPLTAHGVGRWERGLAGRLDRGSLRGARLGILREPIGSKSEPDSEDFRQIDRVFDRAVAELKDAGAELVDPVAIPDLKRLLATRARNVAGDDAMFAAYVAGTDAPFRTRAEVMASPLYAQVTEQTRKRWAATPSEAEQFAALQARETLMTNLLDVMARHRLDAIVHKAVEHQPTLIEEGTRPPFADQKGAPSINTFLVFVPSIVVPAGFTGDGLPAGITFLGRPYDDARMVQLAYAYEQATRHRRVPTW